MSARPSPMRAVKHRLRGQPTSDGAGVKLTRVIGSRQLPDLDPFLMLDEFGSDRPSDYIAGFPDASAPRLRDRHLHARRPHAPQRQPRQ